MMDRNALMLSLIVFMVVFNIFFESGMRWADKGAR